MKKVVILIITFMLFSAVCYAKIDTVIVDKGISYSVDMDSISVYGNDLLFNLIINNDSENWYQELGVTANKDNFRFDRDNRYDKTTKLRIDGVEIPSKWAMIEEGTVIKKVVDYVRNNYKEEIPQIYKNRWALILPTDEGTTYIDAYTYALTMINGQLCISAWFRTELKDIDIVEHIIFNINNLSYINKEIATYNKDGTSRFEGDLTKEGWKTAFPGSNLEKVFGHTLIWVDKHHNSYPGKALDKGE